MNERIIVKYPKFYATIEPILQAFSSSYMVESGFSHVHYLLSTQKSTLNIGGCG